MKVDGVNDATEKLEHPASRCSFVGEKEEQQDKKCLTAAT